MTATVGGPTEQAWRSRIVRHEDADPRELKANPQNWRAHPPDQREALAQALDGVGWVQSIVVNETSGHVIDGHLRIELAIERGEASVPVVYVDLTPEEEQLVLATLDPLAGMAEPDTAVLSALLDDILMPEGALGEMLAGLAKGAGIVQTVEGKTDPDAVPVPRETSVERGQVYGLGAHRLMCGDATAEADVAYLLAGQRPHLMVTDPPYGVEYNPAWRADAGVNRNTEKLGVVANDDRVDWGAAWCLSPANVAYVWHAGIHAAAVAGSLTFLGFEVRSQIVWAKDRFALSRGHYHWQHEPCWYAVRAGSTAGWRGDHSQTTVWHINAREDGGHGHGTQKPVECMERPIRNHEGDVYDPFVGSGTTIIAAERTGRACYAMEIEPAYIQVSIDRWEAYTGQKAVLLDGETS